MFSHEVSHVEELTILRRKFLKTNERVERIYIMTGWRIINGVCLNDLRDLNDFFPVFSFILINFKVCSGRTGSLNQSSLDLNAHTDTHIHWKSAQKHFGRGQNRGH